MVGIPVRSLIAIPTTRQYTVSFLLLPLYILRHTHMHVGNERTYRHPCIPAVMKVTYSAAHLKAGIPPVVSNLLRSLLYYPSRRLDNLPYHFRCYHSTHRGIHTYIEAKKRQTYIHASRLLGRFTIVLHMYTYTHIQTCLHPSHDVHSAEFC